MTEERATPDLEGAVRRSTEDFNRGDFDGAVAIYGPAAVWDLSPVGMGVVEGRDAIRGFFEDVRAPYEDFEQVIEEFRDLGNGVGFGVTVARGRLHGSTRRLELRHALVAIWMDGLTERVTYYTDIDEARATAERLAEERGQDG